jgi:hypothetical protein
MWKSEIYTLLKNNQIDFETNTSLSVFEMIYLPQKQLYIHFISLQDFSVNQIPITYFQELSDKSNFQNQRIIHLWEDVWMNKKELAKSRILTMTGKFERLNARHCFVERIDKSESDKFLNDNHLQGSVKVKFKYGLFLKPQYLERFGLVICGDTDNGKERFDLSTKQFNNSTIQQSLLVAVATFAGGRQMRDGTRSYELIRFASLRGYTVMGGLDKMLTFFEKEHNPDDIMTYADRDWSDGRSYEILGFERTETTKPQQLRLDIQNFKRYSINETEEDLIEIFNAGSIKYIRKNEKIFL